MRALTIVMVLWLSVAGAAFAQAPEPDQIFAPLIEQAETDQRAGRLVEARARARATLGRVSVGSPLAGRAHLVLNAAEAATGAVEPSLEVTFEPLVTAAEADAVAGRNSLALARLSAAMSLVPADTALAARARNLYTLASRGTDSPTTAPAPPHAPSPPPPVAPSPQVVVLTPQTTISPPAAAVAPANTGPTSDDGAVRRRRGAEIAELRIAGGALGLLLGINTLMLLDANEPFLFVTIPLFTTFGMAMAAGLLDTGDGMPRGVPAAISTGVLVGFGDGLLIWGVNRHQLDGGGAVLSLLTATTAVGALAGGAFGYGLSPSIAESRFVLSAGVWGWWISLMSALALDSTADGTWMSTLIAYNAGIGTAMLISAVADVSMERVAFINAATFAGGLVGLLVAGVIYGEANQRERKMDGGVVTASLAIGSAAGLIAGLMLPERDVGGSRSGLAKALVDADFDVMLAPTDNGMSIGFTGKI